MRLPFIGGLNNKNIKPAASTVLTCYLKQCKEPPWTSFFIKYSSVKDDQWGKSHFNWKVGKSNYHVLRTGCFPYVKYHCTKRQPQNLLIDDIFFRFIKVINFEDMQQGPTHEAVKPLSWLIGRWKSVNAVATYPTMEPLNYCEEMSFESLGQPVLNYTSNTWVPNTHKPMHLESGFLRIKPGTNQVAFMVAHNFGLTSIEEGTVHHGQLICKSKQITRMSSANNPAVLTIERCIRLKDNDNLEITVSMETTNTPLTQHLKVELKKYVPQSL